MVSIVEQAKQNPRNATPIGRDPSEVQYPGVNTCATITACCLKNLIGMHLGLFMGAGDEGGKGSENSEILDVARLGMYLNVMQQHIKVNGGSEARKIIVAGALDVWKTSARPQWTHLRSEVEKMVGKDPSKVLWYQFDDEVEMTVDIYVTWKNVVFTAVGARGTVVPALGTFRP